MKNLSLKGRLWLKGLHLFLICAWLGAGISMILLGFAKQQTTNGDELYAINAAIKLIDDFIVIPAAMGTLLTGLLFSLFTNWRFAKFYCRQMVYGNRANTFWHFLPWAVGKWGHSYFRYPARAGVTRRYLFVL